MEALGGFFCYFPCIKNIPVSAGCGCVCVCMRVRVRARASSLGTVGRTFAYSLQTKL